VNTANNPKFGEVAIIGRPNVGKSTLINALVGEKISITSAKPHTTRHRVLGILNQGLNQAVFVDTPGHERRSNRALHRLMARVVHHALESCDLILLVVEATGLTDADHKIVELLGERLADTIIVVNKIDKLKHIDTLLPFLAQLQTIPCAAFVPISAKRRISLEQLSKAIFAALPAGPAMFPLEMTTDRDLAFRAAELIREKLIDAMYQEVPYGLTVEIEHMSQNDEGRWLIHALIWIEKESHKSIVIGKQGQRLKAVGTKARLELVEILNASVHLELWVKVREHWSDSEQELHRLGFDSL